MSSTSDPSDLSWVPPYLTLVKIAMLELAKEAAEGGYNAGYGDIPSQVKVVRQRLMDERAAQMAKWKDPNAERKQKLQDVEWGKLAENDPTIPEEVNPNLPLPPGPSMEECIAMLTERSRCTCLAGDFGMHREWCAVLGGKGSIL